MIDNTGRQHPYYITCKRIIEYAKAVKDKTGEDWPVIGICQGLEVVAVVQLRESAGAEELLEECARHIARYKLPKDFVFREKIVRSPSGKADYRWAREQVEAGAE